MSKRILVLGGAGFIGSSIAIALSKNNPEWRIVALDNLRRRGSELNLPRIASARVQFVHGDIRVLSDLMDAVPTVDTIVDCSAEPSVVAGATSPQYVLQANLVGTTNVLEFARQRNASLIFLSSSRVYSVPALLSIGLRETAERFVIGSNQSISGVSERGVTENFSTSGPRTLYGATKLASEMLIEEYRHTFGLRAVVNRCGVVTGPWQMGKVDQGVFVLWMAAHYFKTPLSYVGYRGTGKQVRDLLHVSDLTSLVDAQLQRFSEVEGGTWNVGGGVDNSLSLRETTVLCEQMTGHRIPIEQVSEERAGDIPWFITDHSRISERTGWKPTKSTSQTMSEIHEWINMNENALHRIFNSKNC